jgi:Protein of unknown function./Domain of unknown function (DUF1835).
MIEIVFGDSACASLKIAQRYGDGDYCGGSSGVIIGHSDSHAPTRKEIEEAQREIETRERLAWEKAVPLGGNPNDVFGFSLVLDVGDISENEPGPLRMHAFEQLWSIYPNEEGRQAARELLQAAADNLITVRQRLLTGESLRIWCGNQPDEVCGLHWFMSQLVSWERSCKDVFLVRLPQYEIEDGGIVTEKNGFGECQPADWHRYVASQQLLPLAMCHHLAMHWCKLQRDNAPLRAVINGQLMSVEAVFYDGFIQREIGEQDDVFHEAKLIGNVLGKYRLGIGDAWIAQRIEEMIRQRSLEPVDKADSDSPIYHRTLKKCTMP